MIKNNDNFLHAVVFLIIIFSGITTLIGLLYDTGGKAFDFVNQYGDTVKMYGNGLYAHDSYFMAQIARGTDFTILCVAIPMLIVALLLDVKKKTVRTRLFLISGISVFTYYSASIAFGVTYNILHLVYILLFSTSLFGLFFLMGSLDLKQVESKIGNTLPYRGINTFLVFTGIALIVAWLPDIISSLIAGRSLELIEVYTTAVTYILDMGVIAPAIFICIVQLKKRSGMGYVLLGIILTNCLLIGIMLPIQTAFQVSSGIELPFTVIATKVISFVILSCFALYFDIKFFINIR